MGIQYAIGARRQKSNTSGGGVITEEWGGDSIGWMPVDISGRTHLHIHDACLTPRAGDIKYVDRIEYAFDGNNWRATGKAVAGLTNTPRAGELEGSRDRHRYEPTTTVGWALAELATAAAARLETDSAKRKDVNDVLNERENTHGNFGDNARISQATKALWRSELGWAKLDDDMKEVLEMEALKIGRILSGNPNEPDHWLDNSGYPAMIANRLKFGTHKV